MIVRRPSVNTDHRRRGSALVMTSVIVMLAAGMGAAMLHVQSGMSARHREMADRRRAFYVAEAGLSESFLAIASGKSGNVGSAALPAAYGDGVFWVEAQDKGSNLVAIQSNGLCGSGRFSLAMTLERQVNPVASLGVFGSTKVTVKGSAVLDGYESALGSYSAQAIQTTVGLSTAKGAAVRTNANITVASPATITPPRGLPIVGGITTIFGNATPGPGYSVLTQPNVNITGSTTPGKASVTSPKIEPPVVTSQGTLNVPSGPVVTLTESEVGYDTVKVQSGGILKIKGPASVVAGSIVLASGAKLELDGSTGPILVYVKDSFQGAANSTISSLDADPKSVALLVNASTAQDYTGDGIVDQPVVLNSSGTFYGVFYAPNAAVTVPASLRMYGSVAAKDLTIGEQARVSFDKSLLTHASVLKGYPKVVGWKVTALPDVPIVTSRRDPLAYLRDLAVAPLLATEAHLERTLSITFVSNTGMIRFWTGPADTFDWSNVKTVISKVWSA